MKPKKHSIEEQLEELRARRARNHAILDEVSKELLAMGNVQLSVPRRALEALDRACHFHFSPTTRALRG